MIDKKLLNATIVSLKKLALSKFIVTLWKEEPVLTSIEMFQFQLDSYNSAVEIWCHRVEDKVVARIMKLQPPKSMAKDMIRMLKSIGLRILEWKLCHEDFFREKKSVMRYLDVTILHKLCFTGIGTLDYLKTAEEILRCNVLDVVRSYKLASLYCLDHYITEFWMKFSEEDKKNALVDFPRYSYQWPIILQGKVWSSMTISLFGESSSLKSMFHWSAYSGNKVALEYFLGKLSPEERESASLRVMENAVRPQYRRMRGIICDFPNEQRHDALCYLLSIMTDEQRTRMCRKWPAIILGCFLDLQRQHAFLDVADAMWNWIQGEDRVLREELYTKVYDSLQESIGTASDYDPNLYQQFFIRSPGEFRKLFVNRECSTMNVRITNYTVHIRASLLCKGFYFTKLFYVQDAETINVILRTVDAEDRARLLSSPLILKQFHDFILKDKMHVVESCLRGNRLSSKDREKLKKDLVAFKKGRFPWVMEDSKWKKFFEFLDETDATAQSKRYLDHEESTGAKKLCMEIKNN